MKSIAIVIGPLALLVADTAVAQTTTQPHDQHQGTGQHPASKADERCCCDERMREMMMHMMQMHQDQAHPPGQHQKHQPQPPSEQPQKQ